MPNAYSFDHYTHIRADLFAPRGPLTASPPPSDELRLVPALDWIEAALPQQNPRQLAGLTGAVEIALSGPAARAIRIGPGQVTAQIRSDAPSFIRWVTRRASWEELAVEAAGSAANLAAVRQLHVF